MANIIRKENGNAPAPRLEWDPFRAMREMLGWDPFREAAPLVREGWVPSFEVKENQDSYVFKADLPGVKDSDLDITLTQNRLTIQGKREAEKEDSGDTFYAYERSYGSFSRSFTLPEGIDADHLRADLKDGVLTLVLPKLPEVKPKKITVSTTAKPKV